MAEIEISPPHLIVHIEGADRFLALKTHLEVPLEHITSVDATPPEAHEAWHGMKAAGSYLPGVVTAGRFVQHGEWAFWDVHDPEKAVAIRLRDEHYAKLVIGVDDPTATVAAIEAELRHYR
ncbi:MAG TPA: hypothetical protein VEK76_11255 [Candidatus Binatia bacterium]|nr:hypothetical protein [Candidatus Binatia bacterium]